jgi:hypothetical protein
MIDFSLYPITLQLSNLKKFEVKSLINVLPSPNQRFFDEEATLEFFLDNCKSVYEPILDFVEANELFINLVITGDFVDLLDQYRPDLLARLNVLLSKNQIILIADSFYGESLSSMYNFQWWQESIQLTIDKIKEKFADYQTQIVFLPQLYRRLPLEQIVWDLGITRFLLRQKGNKGVRFETTLSDLRRFDNHSVEWINDQNDRTLTMYYYPDTYFFQANYNLFYMDKLQAAKAFSMAFGFKAVTYDPKKSKLFKSKPLPRISEHYSIAYYDNLQKAVIRLWGYGSAQIMSEYGHQNLPFIKDLFNQFAILQNKDFLFYLNPKIYSHKASLNFTSPYEAFAFMQASISQIDILLRNKI